MWSNELPEIHVAAVAVGGGSKYPKHVDNACECDSTGAPMDKRKLTVVYYLDPKVWAWMLAVLSDVSILKRATMGGR